MSNSYIVLDTGAFDAVRCFMGIGPFASHQEAKAAAEVLAADFPGSVNSVQWTPNGPVSQKAVSEQLASARAWLSEGISASQGGAV